MRARLRLRVAVGAGWVIAGLAAGRAPLGARAQTAASASASAPASSSAPVVLPEAAALQFEKGQGAYVAPAGSAAGPLAVYLHGMCASGSLECPVFAGAAAAGSWLLCADGGAPCGGGGFQWIGVPRDVGARLERAEEALRGLSGAQVTAGPRAIVGYSLGAPAALLQVLRSPGRYDRLMIVNASVEPSAAALKQAGVRRVALVAGERDATAGKLRLAARRLAALGVDARFFALASTGHYFDARSAERMAAPLAWWLGP